MSTLEILLGANPSLDDIEREFEKRGLELAHNENVVLENGKYWIHGNHSTRSNSRIEALMKFAILLDELE